MGTVALLLFCLVSWRTTGGKFLDNEVESGVELQCIQHCPYVQNRTDISHYDYACNYNCTIEQCNKGCKLWKNALDSSCRNSCNGTAGGLTPRALHCVMGCNDALAKYFAALRARLGAPPAPALLPDTRGATSLKLEWRFPEARRAGLSCHLQWRYEDLGASWQYCRDAKWDPDRFSFSVEGLQPYTKYRFRVALHLGRSPSAPDPQPVLSAASVVVSTQAGGVPTSPPRNVRAAAVDARSAGVGWGPGAFPRGPLLSYVLSVAPAGRPGAAEVKDISPENHFYMLRDLSPETRYQVNISMRNNAGAGPPAMVFVDTPAEIKTDPSQPVLIIGTNYCVFKLWPVLGDPTFVYYSTHTIRGIAVHVNKKLLFVSESNGNIMRVGLDKENDKKQILSLEQLDFYPLDLSIDWLNNHLYILGEVKYQNDRYIIKRCNLDGSGLSVALAGLNRKPLMIQVDPYNGFLFWAIKDFNRGGLYRLDLSDISNGVKHEVRALRIIKRDELGAFLIDYANFRLLVSYQNQNTINAMSLKGEEVTNFRKKVMVPKFEKVVSLTMANQKFYWTDGVAVFNEEYHNDSDNYFHNKNNVPNLHHNTEIIELFANHSASQPLPIPVNPPTKLQAVFGSNVARIRWLPPELLGVQSKGAWQNWSYEISITNINSSETQTYRNINTNSFTVSDLNENTSYIMKVAAYTSSGKGPLSSSFVGHTLPKNENPLILWSTANGLIKSDAVGENIETLIDKEAIENLYFKDITWFKDVIYLVSNTSHVYWYNLTSKDYHRLLNLHSVDSIAVDWIGKKLYWSNPKQQLIIRGNLHGGQQEPLPIVTLATELNIDSIMAYLYWSTEYKVECAHLNGADTMKYHQVEYFTGKQVTGLTLDMENKFVYWTVRGSAGSTLYKAPMAGYFPDADFTPLTIDISENPEMPLYYFHNRLFWLQNDTSAVISDLNGTNIATLSNKAIYGLNMVYIMDDSMHILPENHENPLQINVIPEVIDKKSIKVTGSSETFNITWKPIERVNYGTVFYEIQIDTNSKIDSVIKTTEPTVKYWREVTPFTQLHVAIRAFTYWGTSPQVTAKVFSPPSTPSAPQNLRAYVVYEYNNSLDENYVSIIFRWDRPVHPNGVIQGYKVRCWYLDNDIEMDICEGAVTPSNNTEYVIKELTVNEMYFFQVQAFTEIGDGTLSKAITVNSSHESPLPTLLVASSDSIFIDDIDANHTKSLLNGIYTPLEINYLMKENKVFWINKMKELLQYNFESGNKSKVLDIKGEPTGISLDWLERSIYYVENSEDNNGSTIYKVDLNDNDKGVTKNTKILSRPSHIAKIEISPFTKKLYWLESTDESTHQLMQSNLDGTDTQPFFQKYNYKRDVLENSVSRQCNCSLNTKVDSTFTIDHSNSEAKPLLVFIDAQSQNVVSSDKNGCFCNIIANNTLVSSSFPLKKIKSDFGTLYWTNRKGLLYALKRKDSNIYTKPVNVHDILIYGQHTQPYPPVECLKPQQNANLTVTLVESNANSLLLKMPEYTVKNDCMNTSVATVFYTVFYKQYHEVDDNCANGDCKHVSTTEDELEVTELKSFTKYIVSVAVSNHFTESEAVIIGPPVVLQTAPGAPSKARNVSALVLHPTLVEVNWLPPEELNGIIIHYEIHWLTKGSLGVKQKGEQPVVNLHYVNDTKAMKTVLTKLSPNETYTIWVRVYSERNETSSDSDRVQITTYPEPHPFILINRTAYSLVFTWEIAPHIQKYVVEQAPITSSHDWSPVATNEHSNGTVFINVANLKPKTQYKFRLSLLYEKYSELYIWPSDLRFTFETCGDRPSAPGAPRIQYVQPKIYKVWWEASKDNGAPVEMYLLEGIKLRVSIRSRRSTNRTAWSYLAPSVEEEEKIWEPLYNGTDTSWIISGISDRFKYAFRVSALNSYGWSEPSIESTEFDINEAARIAEKPNPIYMVVTAICVPIILCFCVISCVVYLSCSTRCKKAKEQKVIALPRGPDVELATLRELPRRGVHNTNILYVSTIPSTEELTKLPHIRRDQITLTKFLGSGAFGEVFEGKAKGIGNDVIETKVAVKTLKKGASDQEKSEFLQEAQLMSHFKHEHILELLGVCLDNDPHFIIMELMQGGDLLTYLRESRHPSTNKPSLTLIELMKMCVDVSKGCKYLEEKHFVHRDLACRNCLVSSLEAESRIVKIGDFGLARDIYKNDYYRKEGEGLLPVRWMAPESLVDGVFTSQSDVWAFGVLLWEIMTLGQQPYPARNNLEVLHYVRRGGRLGKPTDCPTDLYNLMLECWEYDQAKRPTFKYCLGILENSHQQKMRNPTTAAHEGQYISTVPELFAGISNAAYFLDENYNSSGISWKSESEDDNVREKTPFLDQENETKPKDIPKYLELIYEPESTTQLENDGYEVPTPLIKAEIQANLQEVATKNPEVTTKISEVTTNTSEVTTYSNVGNFDNNPTE